MWYSLGIRVLGILFSNPNKSGSIHPELGRWWTSNGANAHIKFEGLQSTSTMLPLSKLVARAWLSTEIFVRWPSTLRTSDCWWRFINDAQSARRDARDGEQQDRVRNAGWEWWKLGKKGSLSWALLFWIHSFWGDLHLSGWGMVCLSSAMQISLPKAAMTEELKKNTQRQNVLVTRHS